MLDEKFPPKHFKMCLHLEYENPGIPMPKV